MFDSVRNFLDQVFWNPMGQFVYRCLRVQIFGTRLWNILLTLLIFSIFSGWIAAQSHVSSGLVRGFVNAGSASSRRVKASERDRWASRPLSFYRQKDGSFRTRK